MIFPTRAQYVVYHGYMLVVAVLLSGGSMGTHFAVRREDSHCSTIGQWGV